MIENILVPCTICFERFDWLSGKACLEILNGCQLESVLKDLIGCLRACVTVACGGLKSWTVYFKHCVTVMQEL